MKGIDAAEALEILQAPAPEVYDVLARAGRARHERSGDRVSLCAILNARSGACSQDCAFCAQSASHGSGAEVYPLLPAGRMVEAGRTAERLGAVRLSLVTSGRAVSGAGERRTLARAVKGLADEGRVIPCASLGLVSREVLEELREAGLERYHHNIETAPSHYARICTTRRQEESFETVRRAREAGLSTCSGGILGLGETREQRVEFLAALRDLDPDAVPLNFYVPVPGARIPEPRGLGPWDCLRAVAAARLMMPGKEIRIAAGRALHLGTQQALLFLAGAEGLMVGDLLTTAGTDPEADRRLLAEAGLRAETRR